MSDTEDEIFPLEPFAGLVNDNSHHKSHANSTSDSYDETLRVLVGTDLEGSSLIALQSAERKHESGLDIDHYDYLKDSIKDVKVFDQVLRWIHHNTVDTPQRDLDGQVSSCDLLLLLKTAVMAHRLSMWSLCSHAMDIFVRASAWNDFAYEDEVFDFVYSDECDVLEIKDCVVDAAIYNMWIDGGISRHFEIGEMRAEHQRNVARRLRGNDTFDLMEDGRRDERRVWNPLFARSCSYHPHEYRNCDQCPERGLTIEQSYDRYHYNNDN